MATELEKSAVQKAEPSGVLVVNKHAGVTSHDIVGMIRRLYHTRSVGHTGTLDPMATGVLVVLVGRAVKASEYLMHERKKYRATLRLGLVTDTGDVSGSVLQKSDRIPDAEAVFAVLPRFRGAIEQIPPMYSALKVNGRKLVDLARRGTVVEREPRPVTVFSLDAFQTASPCDYTLDVCCSGGTYIRTLCEDIGNALGCGGTMANLCRTETCGFPLEKARSIEELEPMSDRERAACLLPVDTLFTSLPRLTLQDFHRRLLCNGCAVLEQKLGIRLPVGERVRLYDQNGQFLALGQAVESPEGVAIRMVKQFVLS